MTDISAIRERAAALYAEALVWVAENPSPWSRQLVDDAGKVVNTVRWIEGDIERRRIDDIEKAK